MELILFALKIAAVSYIGLSLLVFVRQASYVYYPNNDVGLTPGYFQIDYEDIKLTTDDGETIAGWFVPASGEKKGALLFCHGNAGNMGDRIDSIRTFNKMGLDVLIIDYRGYGDSTGKPTEKGTYLDVKAAWDYMINKGVPGKSIIIFGRSLGGGIASWLAEQVDPGMLVIESSFTSAMDMAKKMFPFLSARLICKFKYDTLSRIDKINCPVFISHSRDDETVPFKHAQRLFERALEPKSFVEMSGPHNSGGMDIDSECQEKLSKFIAKHLVSR